MVSSVSQPKAEVSFFSVRWSCYEGPLGCKTTSIKTIKPVPCGGCSQQLPCVSVLWSSSKKKFWSVSTESEVMLIPCFSVYCVKMSSSWCCVRCTQANYFYPPESSHCQKYHPSCFKSVLKNKWRICDFTLTVPSDVNTWSLSSCSWLFGGLAKNVWVNVPQGEIGESAHLHLHLPKHFTFWGLHYRKYGNTVVLFCSSSSVFCRLFSVVFVKKTWFS